MGKNVYNFVFLAYKYAINNFLTGLCYVTVVAVGTKEKNRHAV